MIKKSAKKYQKEKYVENQTQNIAYKNRDNHAVRLLYEKCRYQENQESKMIYYKTRYQENREKNRISKKGSIKTILPYE